MNSPGKDPQQAYKRKLSLLAETFGGGLHSLAQPLTRAQWSLETAILEADTVEMHREKACEALSALEDAAGILDFLRYVASPFRAATTLQYVSVRDALLTAIQEYEDTFQKETIEVQLQPGSHATILTVQLLMERICSSVVGLVCIIAPRAAAITLDECEEEIVLQMSLSLRDAEDVSANRTRSLSTLRAYIEVLGGVITVANDCSLLTIQIPKSLDSDSGDVAND